MLILGLQKKNTQTGQAQKSQELVHIPPAYRHFFLMFAKRQEPLVFSESHLSNMLSQVLLQYYRAKR